MVSTGRRDKVLGDSLHQLLEALELKEELNSPLISFLRTKSGSLNPGFYIALGRVWVWSTTSLSLGMGR